MLGFIAAATVSARANSESAFDRLTHGRCGRKELAMTISMRRIGIPRRAEDPGGHVDKWVLSRGHAWGG